MKKASVLFLLVTLIVLAACTRQDNSVLSEPSSSAVPDANAATAPDSGNLPAPGENFPDALRLIVNGEQLDAYTSQYEMSEQYAMIPVEAFLKSIGANYADSPANAYGKQCYELLGKRFLVIPDLHLFLLEEDYWTLLEILDAEGLTLSREAAADLGLLPKNDCIELSIDNGTVTYCGELRVDSVSLMNTLQKSGIDITIESDFSTRTISVSLRSMTTDR